MQDVANVWWAILIANTVYQVLWWALLFGQQFILRRDTMFMLLPDFLAAILSGNILLLLLNHWNIDYPNALYATLIYIVVVNLTHLLRVVRVERGNPRRLHWTFMISSNAGFVIFSLQIAVMTGIF